MDLGDFLNTNTTDSGGELTEEGLKRTFDSLMASPRPERQGLITSTLMVRRAHAQIERADRDADAAKIEVYRLRKGWRRLRLIARRRAAERYMDSRTFADSLAATFGRR